MCTECAAGWYSAPDGAGGCLPCPPGTFSDVPGANSSAMCTPCPSGTYGENAAATNNRSCIPCPHGTYSAESRASSVAVCVSCPALATLRIGAVSEDECIHPHLNQDFSLEAGSDFKVTLGGQHLDTGAARHAIQVMIACGESVAPGFEDPASSIGGTNYSFGRPDARGGDFDLCWCSASAETTCEAQTDFKYRLGARASL